MSWPWVSRYRLEFVEAQLREANAERLRLQELLLAPQMTTHALTQTLPFGVPAKPVTQADEEPSTPKPAASTPFDRIETSAKTALQQGKMPLVFKARIR
jgi:hypothetical protein